MDELENQALPPEPEHMEDTPAVTAEEAVPAENLPEPTAEEPAEGAGTEEAVPETPAPQPVPQYMPQEPPRRRSPYENSPYMMPHQPRPQTPPVQEPPKKETLSKQEKKKVWLATLAVIAALTLLVSTVAWITGSYCEERAALKIQSLEERIDVLQEQLEARENASSGESISGSPNAAVDGGMTPGQVYARNVQSVVLIETDMATGSGFILTEDGYVVTNYHVVEDGNYISVVTSDRADYDAELVGYDAGNDVALLKMTGEGFPAVALGSSDALIVGDQVVAIGNPLGDLTSTLTVGYVSAKERDVATDNTTINMIQTDCAINSGNSGGPLFNMKGEVVGITTAKYSGTSSSGASIEGIGFAIPMDDVVGILEDLMEFGYVKSAYLGVSVYSVDPGEASMFNLPLGCLVDSVTPGGCADIAGVKPSDIITALGGYTIESYTDLARALRAYDGGETTTITVYRSGKELVLTITLDAKVQEPTATVPKDDSSMPSDGSYEEWYEYFFGE